MTEKLDILFIHESKEIDKGTNRIALFPVGLLAMADLLSRNGIKVKIFHHLIEKTASNKFNLSTSLKSKSPRIICFDLHWHQQTAAVFSLIKKTKKILPGTTIVIGGLTASYFYKEIMARYGEVSYLIRGDAEIPLLKLAKHILRIEDIALKDIPNLVYRKNSTILTNPISYKLTEKIAGNLSFSNFDLLINKEYYNKPGVFEGVIGRDKIIDNFDNPAVFYYPCGRGCPYDCAICGGSRSTQNLISGRDKIFYLPKMTVLKDLDNMRRYGLDTWYNTFDPRKDKKYFLHIFKEIHKKRIKLNLQFECLHIPSKEFLNEASATFKKVRLDFVLQTGSDSLRKLIKGNPYTNNQLINLFIALNASRIRVDLCFVAGLPYETEEDVISTLTLINFIKNNFPRVNCVATHLEIEPGSPIYLNPKKFKIKLLRKNFNSFLSDHRKKSTLGYETERFSLKDINMIKRLYIMEYNCKKKISGFLKTLSSMHQNKRSNILSWYKFCRSCKFFNSCSYDNEQ